MVDLGGRTLVPGFVDAHGHVVVGGLQALSANLLAPPDGKVQDIASLQQTLRDWMPGQRGRRREDNLIIGFGYDNAQLKELRHPTERRAGRGVAGHPDPAHPPVRAPWRGQLARRWRRGLRRQHARTRPAASSSASRAASEPNGMLEETAFFAGMPEAAGPHRAEGLEGLRRARAPSCGRATATPRPRKGGPSRDRRSDAAGGRRGRLRDRRRHLPRRAGRPRLHQDPTSARPTPTASASRGPSSPSTARPRASPPGATGPTTSRSATIRRATRAMPQPRPNR